MSKHDVTIIFACDLCGKDEVVIRPRDRWRVGHLSVHCSECRAELSGQLPPGQKRQECRVTVWDEKQTEEFKSLWMKNLPSDVIAETLGVSVNAINIKRYTLKLPKRSALTKRKGRLRF